MLTKTASREGSAARCPSCSQNAHDKNVLAWANDASRRVEGGRVRRSRSKGQPWPLPLKDVDEVGKSSLSILRTILAPLLQARSQRGLSANWGFPYPVGLT